MKYVKSRFLWNCIVASAKTYNHIIRICRFSCCGIQFGPPKVRDLGSEKWVMTYNKTPNGYIYPATYHKIYDKITPKDVTPVTIDKKVHPNADVYLKWPQYDHFVASIPHGKIVGTYTNLTPDNNILRDGARYPSNDLYSNPYTYKLYLGQYQKDNRVIALLTSNDSFKNYWHWILNVIPKIHLYQKSGIKIDAYASDYVSHFNKETIDILGLDDKTLIKVDDKTRLECKELVISSTVSLCGYIPQRAIDYIQSLFVPHKNIITPPTRKIFISRITTRKVSNEKEILAYLEPLGFERVELDKMSIREQADIFSSASYVIGAHGAGLVNTVFCRPGTKVIELQHQEIPGFHIFGLAESCSHKYAYVRGDTVVDKGLIEMDQDMYIPLDSLQQTMALLQ